MKGIVTALAIAAVFYSAALVWFTPTQASLVGSVALMVTLWTNEALPLGVVSMLPILLFPSLGIMPTNDVTPNYAKSIIFLFLGGFMLALAIEKSGLHRYFSAKLLSVFPKTPRGIIYALAVTSALLSAVLSNTTITLMLMPIALYLSENPKLKARFLLATAYGASIGGILTPIGTPPNLILLGFLEDKALPSATFGGWMLMTAPIVATMLLAMPYLLSLGTKGESVADIDRDVPVLDRDQKRLYGIILLLSVLLVANTFLKQVAGFALNEKLLLLGFGLALFLPGVNLLNWEDSRNIPYEIIFLFGAGFSIASAFSHTGLAQEIAQRLHVVSELPFVWMIVIVAFFVTFSTEVTSNTALTSIALPIFYEMARYLPQEQTMTVLMTATVAASYAFMLPIATPPNAIVMSSRAIRIREMATAGFKLNLLGIAVLSFFAVLYWPRVM